MRGRFLGRTDRFRPLWDWYLSAGASSRSSDPDSPSGDCRIARRRSDCRVGRQLLLAGSASMGRRASDPVAWVERVATRPSLAPEIAPRRLGLG